MATASDVPNRYDVVINGVGYMCLDREDVKAQYGFTPTFVARQNVQGDFGDNQQDFYLTAVQRDWSLGEEQRFYRASDETSIRRCWRTDGVDLTDPGQAKLRGGKTALTFAATVRGAVAHNSVFFAEGATNLYEVSTVGAITDRGAHGGGGSATDFPFASDGALLFLTQSGGDIRTWNGAAFAAFSTDGPDGLVFLNNALYAWAQSGGTFTRYDTAGAGTVQNTYKGGTGTAGNQQVVRALPFGGKIVLLTTDSGGGYQLWIYDGTGVSLVAEFPSTFIAHDLAVANGVVWVVGSTLRIYSGLFTEVYYWANGSLGRLYTAPTGGGTGGPGICPWANGIAFYDPATERVLYHDMSTGGIFTLFSFTSPNLFKADLAANENGILLTHNHTSGAKWPSSSAVTSGTLTTSLFDFDSSLDKVFRAIKVDFDAATDGNGGSVDISYRVNDLDGSYTSLQVGAVSGTEYLLSGITGRSISVKITLNKGTSTAGPILKRVYVRAVPRQFSFRRTTFVLNLSGRDGESPVKLRNDELETQDGLTLATALRAAATSSTPVSMTDEFGTFTGIIEADGFQLRRIKPNEFIAVVPVREV